MKRLLAYLFLVLGLGLVLNVNANAKIYCVENKIDERLSNFKDEYISKENHFFYSSSVGDACIFPYTKVTFQQYNYFKNLFGHKKLELEKKSIAKATEQWFEYLS